MKWLSPIILLLIWEACANFGIIDARFFPAPSAIFYYLIFISPGEGILTDIMASLNRIFWGYLAGSTFGATLGITMGLNATIRNMLYPLIALTYPIPKIAILPLIMLVFGLGEMSKIMVVAIGSFFLVLLNTLHGVDSMAKIHYDVARVYRITKRNFIFRVVIPSALPSIFTGLKLGIGYSLVMVVAAEMSGADAGIGYLIWQSWEMFSITAMYAAIFVIGAIGLLFSLLLEYLERRLITWRVRHIGER